MCGIAGEIRFDGEIASVAAVAAVVASQTRRGPDAAGLFHQGRVAFGHRRLKIIDTSERAQQPMVDAALGLAIVFNGAIYNHVELRGRLEGLGYTFFSSGDTEVILKAFHAWGTDCVRELSGMFAFAIWERETGRVTLARDRLGIKPLYTADLGGKALRFASSLPALLTDPAIDRTVDRTALDFYMNFHAVVPPPWTILRGIRKVPPATVVTLERDGTRRDERYWDLEFRSEDGGATYSEEEWVERLLAALRLAVRRRLVADVPVGVLLSGGVDSSVITALIAETGVENLSTFSVGFETVGGEVGDEFEYSDVIAERFATDHHRIRVDSRSRLLPELPNCIRAMAEPQVSHDAIGFYLLSEEVSKHIKVVQSGQGADEVFGGYHWYPPMVGSNDAVADYARAFRDRDHAELLEALEPDFHPDDDHALRYIGEHFARPGAERPIDKALRIDTQVMLVDDPVKRVDNMTMAWGLEARVPFLDHDLVELAARMPPELKIAQGGKHVLKEAARRIIPPEVIDRPKGYFPVPALKYIQGPVLDMVRDVLGSRVARERGMFRRGYVETLLADPDAHITPLRGSKLWQIALLEMWLQAHAD